MAPRMKTSAESFAALHQQVIGLDSDYQELRNVVVGLDRKMEGGFAAIHAKLDERNKTPWGVIYTGLALLLTFCVSIGALAYLPIKDGITAIQAAQLRDFDRLDARDQRLWVRTNEIQRQVDRLEGSLRPLK